MGWFSGTRIGMLALAGMFIAFFVIGASMGMFGDMFQPFFGSIGSVAGASSSTPVAGRTGTTSTTSATARSAATATVRR